MSLTICNVCQLKTGFLLHKVRQFITYTSSVGTTAYYIDHFLIKLLEIALISTLITRQCEIIV